MFKATTAPEMKNHPLADLFPVLSESEFAELKESIAKRGFDKYFPITTFEGAILDGRHRQRVCEELGIRPTYRVFDGDLEAAKDLVRAANLRRRNLTKNQQAEIAAAIDGYTQSGGHNRVDPGYSDKDASVSSRDDESKPKNIRTRAREAGIGEKTLSRHGYVKKHGIEPLKALMKSDKLEIGTADYIAHLPPLQQEDIVLTQGEPADPVLIKERVASHRQKVRDLKTQQEKNEADRAYQAKLDEIKAQQEAALQEQLEAELQAQREHDAKVNAANRQTTSLYTEIFERAKIQTNKVPSQAELQKSDLPNHYWYVRIYKILAALLETTDRDDLESLCEQGERAFMSLRASAPKLNKLIRKVTAI